MLLPLVVFEYSTVRVQRDDWREQSLNFVVASCTAQKMLLKHIKIQHNPYNTTTN